MDDPAEDGTDGLERWTVEPGEAMDERSEESEEIEPSEESEPREESERTGDTMMISSRTAGRSVGRSSSADTRSSSMVST
jgi:hypothetical protein